MHFAGCRFLFSVIADDRVSELKIQYENEFLSLRSISSVHNWCEFAVGIKRCTQASPSVRPSASVLYLLSQYGRSVFVKHARWKRSQLLYKASQGPQETDLHSTRLRSATSFPQISCCRWRRVLAVAQCKKYTPTNTNHGAEFAALCCSQTHHILKINSPCMLETKHDSRLFVVKQRNCLVVRRRVS